jgi:DNA polymerase-1
MITYEDTVGKGRKEEGFAHVPLEKAVPYASEDADITLAAFHVLSSKLRTAGLMDLFDKVEMPLVPVLLRMEKRGIQVSSARLKELSKSFSEQLDAIEAQIYVLAGEIFNIRSSQQLGQILFDKLKLPVQKRTTKNTAHSTDVDVLTTLADHHELPALVLRHRTLAKLKSTYTDALIELIHPRTGRIHTSYNQTVAATGRLSSSDPNLQNIPIRTEEGRQIRSAFLPRKGWQLLSADYSQIELRILAHCSEDPILIKAFQEDEDIHARTAAEVFQVFPTFIDAELRRQAKAINFGIVYGMSPFGLSKQLNISQKMAKTYIDNYFSRYRGVKAFMDRTIAEAHKTRKTTTLLDRIRLLPDIDSTNRTVRQFAERMAINTPIQGSAADLIKLAMIKVDQVLIQKGLRAAMLLTVHDELVFEAPPEEKAELEAIVREIMEGIWDLRVPLKVNMEWGEDWSQVH